MESFLMSAIFIDILKIAQQADDMLAPVNREFRRGDLVQPPPDQALAQDIAHNFTLFQDGHFRFSVYAVMDIPVQILVGLPDEDFFVFQATIIEKRLTPTKRRALSFQKNLMPE